MEQPDNPIRSSPGRVILGLVDASGAGGVKGESTEWCLVFHLAAWRRPGSEVIRRERRCEMPVTKDELQAFMQRVRPYTIVEAEIEEIPDEGPIQLARLVEIGMDDAELARIASELQKPVVLAHPTFGELQYDRSVSSYDGHATWEGKEIQLALSCENPDDPRGVLEIALRLFKGQQDWRDRVNDYVVEELLDLKNECWSDDDEEEMSRDEFLSRITLESIDVRESGYVTFWYDDGDLFLGHAIEVRGHIENGLIQAGLAG